MKRLMLICTILLVACAEKSENRITFANSVIEYESSRGEVEISYPTVTSDNHAIADSINSAITACFFVNGANSFDDIIAEAKEYTADSINYSNTSEWCGFENDELISLNIQYYIYSGGAHGSTTISALTLDKKTGRKLDLMDYIQDTAAFRQLIIDHYLIENNLDINTAAGDIGYFTELSDLPIPGTLELTDKGLMAIYGQYEIACYAVGVTSATIPYEKLKGILTLEITPLRVIEVATTTPDI